MFGMLVSGRMLSVIGLIGNHSPDGIVKKNAIMMIDFALRGGTSPGPVAKRGDRTGPACCGFRADA